jgi:hypothetical protein
MKPVKFKNEEVEVNEETWALVMAIQELTTQIQKLVNVNGR